MICFSYETELGFFPPMLKSWIEITNVTFALIIYNFSLFYGFSALVVLFIHNAVTNQP